MNYLFGWVKIPQELTVVELIKSIRLIEKEYGVDIGIAQFTKIGSSFYKLKLKSKEQSKKLSRWDSERADLVIDNDIKLFKRDTFK